MKRNRNSSHHFRNAAMAMILVSGLSAAPLRAEPGAVPTPPRNPHAKPGLLAEPARVDYSALESSTDSDAVLSNLLGWMSDRQRLMPAKKSNPNQPPETLGSYDEILQRMLEADIRRLSKESPALRSVDKVFASDPRAMTKMFLAIPAEDRKPLVAAMRRLAQLEAQVANGLDPTKSQSADTLEQWLAVRRALTADFELKRIRFQSAQSLSCELKFSEEASIAKNDNPKESNGLRYLPLYESQGAKPKSLKLDPADPKITFQAGVYQIWLGDERAPQRIYLFRQSASLPMAKKAP